MPTIWIPGLFEPSAPTLKEFWDHVLNLPIIAGRNRSPEVKRAPLPWWAVNQTAYAFVTADWREVWHLGAVDGETKSYFVHVATGHYTEVQARHIYRLMTDAFVRWPGTSFGIEVMKRGVQTNGGRGLRLFNAAAAPLFPTKPIYATCRRARCITGNKGRRGEYI